MAGGHYEKSVYDELVKVMARFDSMKKENKKLRKENELLEEDNTRLKNLLNHDSSNTSKPPSGDQKPGRAAGNYNDRKKSGKKPGAQAGHKGTTLSSQKVLDILRYMKKNTEEAALLIGTPAIF